MIATPAESARNGHDARTTGGRVPPSDTNSEQCLVGCFILQPEILDLVLGEVSLRDFYSPLCRAVFSEAIKLRADGRPVDIESLAEAMSGSTWKKHEVFTFLAECTEAIPYAANWRSFTKTIRDRAIQRGLIGVGADLMRGASDDCPDAEELLREAYSKLRDIEERRAGLNAAPPISDGVAEFMDQQASQSKPGIPTGFAGLDSKTNGGFRGGQVVVIAARPAMGKSALAAQTVASAAARGTPALLVTLEMSAAELVARLVSAESRLPAKRIERRDLEEHEQHALRQAASRIARLPIFIDDRSPKTVAQIAALARLHHSRDKIQLVCIDYLGLISPDDKRVPREQQVAASMRELKSLAMNLKIPVIVLAQLNRQIEGRADRKPQLSDLRESGSIEQDADLVLFVDRPATYCQDADPREARLYLRKNRSGPTGEIRLEWHGETFEFRDAHEVPTW